MSSFGKLVDVYFSAAILLVCVTFSSFVHIFSQLRCLDHYSRAFLSILMDCRGAVVLVYRVPWPQVMFL